VCKDNSRIPVDSQEVLESVVRKKRGTRKKNRVVPVHRKSQKGKRFTPDSAGNIIPPTSCEEVFAGGKRGGRGGNSELSSIGGDE